MLFALRVLCSLRGKTDIDKIVLKTTRAYLISEIRAIKK